MKFQAAAYRFTLLGMMVAVVLLALATRFFVWAILPLYKFYNEYDESDERWHHGGIISPVPFWPQYWRRLRGIPEPRDWNDIIRSNDGGVICSAIITTVIILLLIYMFRKHLVRRV